MLLYNNNGAQTKPESTQSRSITGLTINNNAYSSDIIQPALNKYIQYIGNNESEQTRIK